MARSNADVARLAEFARITGTLLTVGAVGPALPEQFDGHRLRPTQRTGSSPGRLFRLAAKRRVPVWTRRSKRDGLSAGLGLSGGACRQLSLEPQP